MKNIFIKKIGIIAIISTAAMTTMGNAFPPPQPYPSKVEVNNTATTSVFWKGSGSYYKSCNNPISSGGCVINDKNNNGSVIFMNGANPNNYCKVIYQWNAVEKVINYGSGISCRPMGSDTVQIG